ncbi:MAG TPA: tRNA (N6-isopentenyl adenosine(37)-C2)-methylthiotransferase MiaB [Acholeplasmataceae bacterium]|nr:tRNA (N6-isopentenyl adenosine(37)-C2)-methylthiotransferase MiaB [Acholeplasmataceae bacterium]
MEKDYGKYFAPSLKEARKRIKTEIEKIRFTFPEHLHQFGKGKKYLIKTYGCQGNEADSEKMAGILQKLGFTETDKEEEADLILLNTCAIRENAENRVFGELGRLKNLKTHNPDLLLGVCGCMPQEERVFNLIKEKYPYIDLVFGTHNIHKLGEYLYDAYLNKEKVAEVFSEEGKIVEGIPTKRAHDRKAWVNIMYGCDEFCTYCIVPYTRGRERSRNPEDILNEVRELAEQGYQEVTLLGQNVNAYGKDLERDYSFADLLNDLRGIPIPRVRFTTSHPHDLDDATIYALGRGGNLMPHLHLPVQSGSDRILKKMNRKYTAAEYLEKIRKLREHVPGISITTDIIVGFPGETEEDFQATLDLLRKAEFEGAFTFIFSPREGTPAAKYQDDLDPAVKKERLLTLNELVNEGYLRGNKRFEGKIVKVLVDGPSDKDPGLLTGYTEHNKLVNFPGSKDLIGKIVDVKIEKAYTWHLRGIVGGTHS